MSNDNAEVPNPDLRRAATSAAFSLTLSRNQVGVLDAVAHGSRQITRGTVRSDSLWVPTAWQLKRLGLLMHCSDEGGWKKPDERMPTTHDITDYYRLTRAGWLMHDLLAEAGLVERVTARKLRSKVA